MACVGAKTQGRRFIEIELCEGTAEKARREWPSSLLYPHDAAHPHTYARVCGTIAMQAAPPLADGPWAQQRRA